MKSLRISCQLFLYHTMLYFVNVGYTADETPMEYCVSSYRVDFNVFTVDLYK